MPTVSITPFGSRLANLKFENVAFHASCHEIGTCRVQVDTDNFIQPDFADAIAYVALPGDLRTFNRLPAMKAGTLANVLPDTHEASLFMGFVPVRQPRPCGLFTFFEFNQITHQSRTKRI